MPIKPLGDRIVVKLDEVKTQTDSGIWLAEQSVEVPRIGTVIDTGPTVSTNIIKGDRVILGRFGGAEVTVGAYKAMIFREEDIIGLWVEDSARAENDAFSEN